MDVKEAIAKIKSLVEPVVEIKAAEVVEETKVEETKVETPDYTAAIESLKSEFSAQIDELKKGIESVTSENKALKEAFSKYSEAVPKILELVEKMSEQPVEKPVEQVTTGFTRFNKAEKEERFARIADSVRDMKKLTIKN